jgi:hypothetical protein
MRAPIARPSLAWRGFVIAGVGSLKVLSFSDRAWEWWEDNVTDALPRSTVRALLTGTVALHLGEAMVARRWGRAGGVDHPGAWTRTTFLWGFPELRLLHRELQAPRLP